MPVRGGRGMPVHSERVDRREDRRVQAPTEQKGPSK